MPQDIPRLLFEIDDAIDPTLVTDRAGVPLVIELCRQLGVAAAIDAHVAIKQRQRGLSPSQLIESLIALWVSGGDRCQDLGTLRDGASDAGIRRAGTLPRDPAVSLLLDDHHQPEEQSRAVRPPATAGDRAARHDLDALQAPGAGHTLRHLVRQLLDRGHAHNRNLDHAERFGRVPGRFVAGLTADATKG